eukprot:scaffold206614_cov23-Tisochrysis_lutea.AAC.1
MDTPGYVHHGYTRAGLHGMFVHPNMHAHFTYACPDTQADAHELPLSVVSCVAEERTKDVLNNIVAPRAAWQGNPISTSLATTKGSSRGLSLQVCGVARKYWPVPCKVSICNHWDRCVMDVIWERNIVPLHGHMLQLCGVPTS